MPFIDGKVFTRVLLPPASRVRILVLVFEKIYGLHVKTGMFGARDDSPEADADNLLVHAYSIYQHGNTI
jgi:hypothetical protein